VNRTERYIVGIDLGTTNCAVGYADTADEQPALRPFPVLQLTGPGQTERLALLPSFIYLPDDIEFPRGSLELPWPAQDKCLVGALARKRGAEIPARLVASAKSWLCHSGIDRTSPILPWKGPKDVAKISPVAASARLLEHIRDAWNTSMARGQPELRLERQEVLITVPASFDAAARDLTQRAAETAGFVNVRLLEEPQAAFYAWIAQTGKQWRRQIAVGDMILVCDIGGGTSDFSLISVQDDSGELALERLAVGNHVLLGGDNMDLALANLLRDRFKRDGTKLDNWQFQCLVHAAREAKEDLFAHPELPAKKVSILGRGIGVVAGTLSTELRQSDLDDIVLEGFLPLVEPDDWPKKKWRLGFRELGLSYESEPAVTRHLAAFLGRQAQTGGARADGTKPRLVCPTAVLFNGGVMKADMLRGRIMDVLNEWIAADGQQPARRLGGENLDLAVALGAAYYGLARRGRGVRIKGGTARAYYIGIEAAVPAIPGMAAPVKAVCVAPFGMEEGTEREIPGQEYGLIVGEPVQFPVFSTTSRKQDNAGDVLEEWEEDALEPAPPLEAWLELDDREGDVVPVTLSTRVTELGMLEVWCVERDGNHRWKLEFNVREGMD